MIASGFITRRAWLGAVAALLLQALFIVPFDRRPAWALLGFMAIGAFTAGLLWAAAQDRALWSRARGSLGAWPMLLGLAFAAWGAVRWSFLLFPYAGRPWVMGLAWMAVGLTLGAILASLDRVAEPSPCPGAGAAAGFRRVLVLAALAFAAFHPIAQRANAHAEFLSSTPIYLWLLLAACIATLVAGESVTWKILAVFGALLAGTVLVPGNLGLFAAMPPAAKTVYWPLFFNELIPGAGPGALTLFIANRTSFGAAAPLAVDAWRYRLPAELGAIGLILFAAFMIALARSLTHSSAESRRFIILTLALAALGLLAPGLARPEMMLLFGLLAGISIGLADHASRLRPYHARLSLAVCLIVTLGAAAGAMTFRHQVALRHHLRGCKYMSQSLWEQAIRSFDKATRWQPDNPEHWLGLACACLPTAQVGDASAYLARASFCDPLRPDLTAEMARWSAGRGRFAEAAVEMSVALQQDPLQSSYRREMETYNRQAKAQ